MQCNCSRHPIPLWTLAQGAHASAAIAKYSPHVRKVGRPACLHALKHVQV